jgi:hypothetical protein
MSKEESDILTVEKSHAQLLYWLEAALDWIDSVPQDTVLPVMPGFCRDYLDVDLYDAKMLQKTIENNLT